MRYTIFTILLLFQFNSFSQESTVTIYPFDAFVIKNIRLGYEHQITERVSLQAIPSLKVESKSNFGLLDDDIRKGYGIHLGGRYYLSKVKLNDGAYTGFQAFYRHREEFEEMPPEGNKLTAKRNYTGIGPIIGYKFVIKDAMVIDLKTGAQFGTENSELYEINNPDFKTSVSDLLIDFGFGYQF